MRKFYIYLGIIILFPCIVTAGPKFYPLQSVPEIDYFDVVENSEGCMFDYVPKSLIGIPPSSCLNTSASADKEFPYSSLDSNETSLLVYRLNRIKELQGVTKFEVLNKYGVPDRIHNYTYLYAIGEYKFGLQIRFNADLVNYVRYVPDVSDITLLPEHLDMATYASSGTGIEFDLLKIEDGNWTYLFVNNSARYLSWVSWSIK